MAAFKKATKYESKARIALCGPSGSGKSFTALRIAQGLGQKIAAIDTEHGSLSKYADLFSFDVIEPDVYDPEVLIQTIHEAEKEEYEVLIVDSLSHYWMGKGGELDRVDTAAKRSNSGNTFAAWKEVTPIHNKLVDTMLSCTLHILVTMRTKTEWVIEKNDQGKNTPRKVGVAPIMRDGIEFEFDICGDLNQSNELIISKTRCPALANQVFLKAGEDVAEIIAAWCKGEAAPPKAPVVVAFSFVPKDAYDALLAEASQFNFTDSDLKGFLRAVHGVTSMQKLTRNITDLAHEQIRDGSIAEWKMSAENVSMGRTGK